MSQSDDRELQESGHSLPARPDIVLTSYPDALPPYPSSPVINHLPPPAYNQPMLTERRSTSPQHPNQEDRQVCSLYAMSYKNTKNVFVIASRKLSRFC